MHGIGKQSYKNIRCGGNNISYECKKCITDIHNSAGDALSCEVESHLHPRYKGLTVLRSGEHIVGRTYCRSTIVAKYRLYLRRKMILLRGDIIKSGSVRCVKKRKKFLFFRYEDCIRCILGSYWWGGADDDRIGSQDAPA